MIFKTQQETQLRFPHCTPQEEDFFYPPKMENPPKIPEEFLSRRAPQLYIYILRYNYKAIIRVASQFSYLSGNKYIYRLHTFIYLHD